MPAGFLLVGVEVGVEVGVGVGAWAAAAFETWKAPTGVTGCALVASGAVGAAPGCGGAPAPFWPPAAFRIVVRPVTTSYQNGEPSPIRRPPRSRENQMPRTAESSNQTTLSPGLHCLTQGGAASPGAGFGQSHTRCPGCAALMRGTVQPSGTPRSAYWVTAAFALVIADAASFCKASTCFFASSDDGGSSFFSVSMASCDALYCAVTACACSITFARAFGSRR